MRNCNDEEERGITMYEQLKKKSMKASNYKVRLSGTLGRNHSYSKEILSQCVHFCTYYSSTIL